MRGRRKATKRNSGKAKKRKREKEKNWCGRKRIKKPPLAKRFYKFASLIEHMSTICIL
jgi:hypothetical protein